MLSAALRRGQLTGMVMGVDKDGEAGESRVRVRHCSAVVVVICFTFLRLRVD